MTRMRTPINPIQEVFNTQDVFSRMEFSLSPLTLTAAQMDFLYFNEHSYDKEATPLTVRQLSDEETYGTNATALAAVIKARFGLKWEKLAATLEAEYNPIENYDLTEEETEEHDLTFGVDVTDTLTHGHSVSRTSNAEATQDNNTFGFNSTSTDGVPYGKQMGTNSVTASETNSGNDVTRQQGDKTDSGTIGRTLTRHGNIGVTTSQQMLQSERDLWQWDILNVIFADVDSILCLKVY